MSNAGKVEKFMLNVRKRLGNNYRIVIGKADQVEIRKVDTDFNIEWSTLVTYEQILYDIDPVSDIVNLCKKRDGFDTTGELA